jgi:hypothetical protein
LSSARRFAKPAAFLALVILLLLLSKVRVPYVLTPANPPPLPDYARNDLMVTAINGASEMETPVEGEEWEPYYPLVSSGNSTENEIIMTPQASAPGCATDFQSTIDINFTISNTLSQEEKGTVKVAVFDNGNGMLLASQLLVMDFQPYTPTSGAARFRIVTAQTNPVFLVKFTFPTADELGWVPAEVIYISLFEYLLAKVGIPVFG